MKFIKILVFFFVISSMAYAAFPPEIDPIMKLGIEAAQKKDYLQAINFFEEAQKISPNTADVYYNLGLAESQIPGRELRAMAWFGAYLVANPNASNKDAIKEQIASLDEKSLNTIAALMKFWMEANEKRDQTQDAKDDTLWRSANLWTSAGDLVHAKEALAKMSQPLDRVLNPIAFLQIKNGDYAGARETNKLIQTEKWQLAIDFEIAIAQRVAGDIAGSDKTIEEAHSSDPDFRKNIQSNVDYQLERINRAQASTLADWLTLFNPKEPFTVETLLFKDVDTYIKTLLKPVYYDNQRHEEDEAGVFIQNLEESIGTVTNMRDHIKEMIKK